MFGLEGATWALPLPLPAMQRLHVVIPHVPSVSFRTNIEDLLTFSAPFRKRPNLISS